MKLAILLLLATLTATAQQPPAGTRDPATPAPPDPRFAQAETALEQSDYAAALPLLTKLAADHPDDPTIAYDLGFAQDNLNHSSEAEAAYRKAISLRTDYPEAHVSLGLLLARQGNPSAAHDHLRAAAGAPTADPAVKAAALRALAQLDRTSAPAEARDELLAALTLTPESPADMLLAAQLAESAAATDAANAPAAEQAYHRILLLQPSNQEASIGLARVLLRENKAAEAEPLIQSALNARPGDPALSAQLISIYVSEKRPTEALPLAESMHSAHPQDAHLTRMLARLYDQLQQPAKSEPLYAQLIAQSPADPTLLDARAAALIQLNRDVEAEPLLKKAILLPNDFPTPEDFAYAASHLAFAASQNDDPNTVLQALVLRNKILPPSASSLYLQATATDRLNLSRQAIALYHQFLAAASDQYPDEAAEARKRLKALGSH